MTYTIAIIDDEESMIFVEKVLLQSKGYKVIAINKSSAAMETILKEKPDLVLMDLIMPEINGIELAYQLKHNPDTKKIKIIAVTGQPVLNQKNMEHFDDLILKPFKSDRLLEKIEKFLKP